MNTILTLVTLLLGPWTATFDEAAARLELTDTAAHISLTGTLAFESDGEAWTVAAPRDGVANRLALVDPAGNVQGYLLFIPNGDELQVMVEHRTRQFYPGTLLFDGEIHFLADSFACRTTPPVSDRVLPLAIGAADSLRNDSLFSPNDDRAFTVSGKNVRISTKSDGVYALTFSGRIDNPAEAVWSFRVKNDYFKNRYVPYYAPIDRARCPKAPTGWMSWNTYFDKATAEDNLAEARLGQKYFQPFGMEFWSIESWQGNSNELPVSKFYNMNLEANEEQFPLGMKKLADDIRALGFRPGIWMAPYGTGNEEFYHQHKEWFLHDNEGNPISSWNGRYTMDPTHPEALENLRRIFEIASHEWGYEFFKIDGMSGSGSGYMAHLYERPEIRARFHDPAVANPFEQTVQILRSGIGPDRVFLACQGHFTGPEAAYADAARTGADIVGVNQPVHWEGVLNQAGRTVNQIFVNNIVFYTDPDTLLVGDLPMEQARVSATIVSLPGQLMFSGDKLATLPPEKIRLIQQTLPVADVKPMNLYPRFEMLPIWDLRVRRDFLEWDVIALFNFNWGDQSDPVGFTLDEIGRSAGDYVATELWTGEYFENITDRFEMPVPQKGCRLIALHQKLDRPQFLSSDRHITQGAIDLTALHWDADAKKLSGTVQLVADFSTTLRFRVPDGFTFQSANAENAELTTAIEAKGRVAAVTLKAAESKETPFTLEF